MAVMLDDIAVADSLSVPNGIYTIGDTRRTEQVHLRWAARKEGEPPHRGCGVQGEDRFLAAGPDDRAGL
ncbi:hypothetical protein C5E09_08445 [Rathayibacter iranicus]|nr:hypothetical protein C5E09_08445 [Rathayibacter iranicus]PPI71000.1 hypothetical protein C5E01_08410 [Rathayibacter iranicus]